VSTGRVGRLAASPPRAPATHNIQNGMKKNGTTARASRGNGLFEVRKSRIQGRGCFATRRIRRGQKIVEYTGERITNEEADRRYDEEKMDRHHTYLFTLDDETCIDGDVRTNIARLINHSCDPNCEAIVEDDRIWIYALTNIQPGVELAYDYKYERTGGRKMEKFYVCHCGSPKCRGSIMVPPKRRKRKKSRR
ncbi:MAG TPA: SET domain-containing protein-lysine N-methyltransferase, partial [Gemmatimonadaceae bacterium]|nr:SET domain-containing protein-lysine N-methyltransferase [Gemmatimonadaceae bacterium]